MEDVLKRIYFGNTVLDYIISLSIILIGLMVVRLLKSALVSRLKGWAETTETKSDDFIVQSLERFGIPALYYFIVYSGLNYLHLSAKAHRVIEIATAVVVTFFIIRLLSSTILLVLQSNIRKQERGEEKLNQLGGLMIIVNIIIWILGIVFLVDNLGYDVTTIIAGLGIGGIAIALAAQNILGDLFNYFVIFFDRPFEVGDFIIVDDKLGTIEYIGIKTTRIRSLSGEQIVIGNSNLTAARIHNFKRLHRRRVLFHVDVEYSTPIEQVREIPEIIKAAVQKHELATLDRCHFAKFADWSLRFETVFFVAAPEYGTYMDIQQKVNLEIMEEFSKRQINFAFPSQTVYFNANKKIEKGFESFIEAVQKPEHRN